MKRAIVNIFLGAGPFSNYPPFFVSETESSKKYIGDIHEIILVINEEYDMLRPGVCDNRDFCCPIFGA